jgi:hypothetical protein
MISMYAKEIEENVLSMYMMIDYKTLNKKSQHRLSRR